MQKQYKPIVHEKLIYISLWEMHLYYGIYVFLEENKAFLHSQKSNTAFIHFPAENTAFIYFMEENVFMNKNKLRLFLFTLYHQNHIKQIQKNNYVYIC